jgi:hypothetical protein
MPIGVWLCVAFLIVVSTVSLVRLFRVGLGAWRTLGSFGERVDSTAAALNSAAERLSARSAALSTDLPRLEAAIESLRVTLARHAVLRAALRDVQDSVSAVAAFYPRK